MANPTPGLKGIRVAPMGRFHAPYHFLIGLLAKPCDQNSASLSVLCPKGLRSITMAFRTGEITGFVIHYPLQLATFAIINKTLKMSLNECHYQNKRLFS